MALDVAVASCGCPREDALHNGCPCTCARCGQGGTWAPCDGGGRACTQTAGDESNPAFASDDA